MKSKHRKLSVDEADFICWEESYYYDNVRRDWTRAARYAWRRACEMFPRLRNMRRPV